MHQHSCLAYSKMCKVLVSWAWLYFQSGRIGHSSGCVMLVSGHWVAADLLMVSWELWRRISRCADVTITLLLPCSRNSSLISGVKGGKSLKKQHCALLRRDLIGTFNCARTAWSTSCTLFTSLLSILTCRMVSENSDTYPLCPLCPPTGARTPEEWGHSWVS